MVFRDTPIRRKLMTVMLLTSSAVLLLTFAGFVSYEVITLRKGMVRGLTTRAEIIAANSTATVAFQDVDDANHVLSALEADPSITAACIYGSDGQVFAVYPADTPLDSFPASPGKPGHRFERSHLVVFCPIIEDDRTLGTVYLKSDLTALTDRYRAFAWLALFIFTGSLGLAFLVSKTLQRQISAPILTLAGTARAISERRDYSVRATKRGNDELGLLTDAFNRMLGQIQEQNESLAESEARVRAVLNSALSAVVVIDSAGQITDWNARAESMFGWPRQAAIGRELAETIIPPRYREAHHRGLGHFLATGEGRVLNRLIELSALRRDGSEFPVELSISPIKTGPAVTFCGFITDITERKRAEERFRKVVESSPNAIVLVNPEGKITMINAQTEKLFGYARAELVGHTIEMLVPERFRAKHPGHRGGFFAAPSTRPMGAGRDLFGLRKDGREVAVEIGLNPIETEEGMLVLASIIDISERKRAEQQVLLQATALESAANAIAITDRGGKILWVNPAFSALTGYAPEEVIGRNPRFLKSGKHDEAYYRNLWATILSGRIWSGGFINRRKDGSLYQDEHTITPVRSKDGTITHFIAIMQDVTERNQAQRVLRKSEAQLRLVWENSLDAMRLVDEAGVIRMVNSAYCRLIGKPREALQGQPMSVLYEAHRSEEVLRHHRERFQAQSIPAHHETEVTLWNGRRMILELSNSFLEIEGQAPLLFSTFRDITERKQAEKRETAFARLGQKLSAVASAAAAARVITELADELFGWDACSLDLYVPEQGLVYPVINIDTIDGKRVDVPPAYVEKAPSAIVRRVLEEGGQLILRRQPYDFSPEAVPFGDTGRPSASLVYVPIHRGEKIIGILSIQSYTSDAYNQQTLNTLQTMADQCGGALERVRAEENVRQLNEGLEQRVRERTAQLEAARQELQDFIDGMSTLNAKVALDGTLLLANKAAQLASGLPLEKLLKTNFLEASWWTFDPQVQTRVRQAFQKACQGETINYEEKLFVFGTIIDISFSLVPVRAADGQIGYIVAEGRDITALKRTEKSLAERTGQLEAANKELEAFSYSVSHDLRAPLRHIDGFADMLRKESSSGLDASGQRYLGIISNAAKRMGALIDDLLIFSRMGRAELRQVRVNMDQLVAETLHDLVRDLEGRAIAWDIGPLPEVSGDRAMLKQVWVNLLSNAVKYTRHREQAAIRISSRKNGKDEWEFSIQDNGAGFDMKYADKLFGVFQRLHQAEEFEGTGIGLANVRRIILRHGGRTWAESKVDAGATFYFTLPVCSKE